MKLARALMLLTTLILCSVQFVYAQNPCSEGTAFRNCKACGTATTKDTQKLNVQKNRDEKVTAPEKITVQQIRKPSNDKVFSAEKKVWVTGYVASVVSGGDQETCNCSRTDLRDIHINIVANPSEASDQSKYVIVEITPRWQQKFNLDDSNYQKMLAKVRKQIQHKWVKFEGPMLRDSFHANQSKSTSPTLPVCPNDGKIHKGCNWRATPWEVHPVTAYSVVPGP